MTNDRIILLAFIAVITISVIVVLKWRQQAMKRRNIEQVYADNLDRQTFIMSRLDAIANLIGDTSISLSDFEQKANALIIEMESQNIDGQISPLIADTRNVVSDEIDKRKLV